MPRLVALFVVSDCDVFSFFLGLDESLSCIREPHPEGANSGEDLTSDDMADDAPVLRADERVGGHASVVGFSELSYIALH
jgi:hypothetical protein